MQDCLFCKLAHKEIPTNIIYEDEYVVAFPDISPVAPVHVLIVSKQHFDNFIAIDNPETVMAFQTAARALAQQFGLTDKGFRLIMNTGEEGGQTIKHVHMHFIGGKSLGESLI